MAPELKKTNRREDQTGENIAYIRQMLGELRRIAEREGEEMLCYLIEMAYVEAGDLQTARRSRSDQSTAS
jgi:hypothetical protein